MKSVIRIDMDNDAFQDGESGTELARILRTLADRVDGAEVKDGDYYVCHDINGNNVGRMTIDD